MNLIEAVNEMKNGKYTKGSNSIIYRIKFKKLEYFYDPTWTKTRLSIVCLSEITFEITENPNSTLSDKICVGVKGVSVDTTEHVESIKLSDVMTFIENVKKDIKNRCDNSCDTTDKIIDKLTGDRFK